MAAGSEVGEVSIEEENPLDETGELGSHVELEAVRYTDGTPTETLEPVATEVPLTVFANQVEVATLLCTPQDLEDLAVGFLFSSGLIRGGADVLRCTVDTTRWAAHLELGRAPDLSLLGKRLFTSGCGKGVVYADAVELAGRRPLQSDLTIGVEKLSALARWIQGSSGLHRITRGVHTAGLSRGGDPPDRPFDDIGRHNAVDKAVGHALLHGGGLGEYILVSSGRTSSEILHKARRAGIAVCVTRGAPTHQAVLRAREGGVTLVGLARGQRFTVYSHGHRIVPGPGAPAKGA